MSNGDRRERFTLAAAIGRRIPPFRSWPQLSVPRESKCSGREEKNQKQLFPMAHEKWKFAGEQCLISFLCVKASECLLCRVGRIFVLFAAILIFERTARTARAAG